MRTWIAAPLVALLVAVIVPGPEVRGDDVADDSPKLVAKEPASPQPPAATPEKKPATPPEKSPIGPPEQPIVPNPGKSLPDKAVPDKKNPLQPKPAPSPEPLKPSPVATTKPAESEFPTPAELIKRLQAQKAEKAKLSKVVHFDLATPV